MYHSVGLKLYRSETVDLITKIGVTIFIRLMDQDTPNEEPRVNLLTVPTELLVYIMSFLRSMRDRVKLRYVSSLLKCVIEGTPSLWKEFVWPYYDSCEEYCMKEVLKVCGHHIKVLSFPNSRLPSTLSLVEMLKYCSNVQNFSLPSTKLNLEQLRKIIDHMRYLQTLQLKMDVNDIKPLLVDISQLKELTILSDRFLHCELKKIFKHWTELEFRPPTFNVVTSLLSFSTKKVMTDFLDYAATELTNISASVIANFRLYNTFSELPLNFFSTFPYYQIQIKESGHGQVTTPCVKLSVIGLLGLNNDVAVMTECQCGEIIMYMIRYQL